MVATSDVLLLTIFAGLSQAIPFPHNAARATHPDWPFNPDLSKLPSVKNKVTLYRAVSNSDELKSTRDRVGKSPEYMSSSYGDFNADGTAVLYFYDDEEDAEIWCEHRLSQGDAANVKECAVATYEWNPPSGVKVKRWEKADDDWYGFVRDNWKGPGMLVAPIQKENDWIEGPLSRKIGGDYQPAAEKVMQHALVQSRMLPSITIKSVSDNMQGIAPDKPDFGEMPMYDAWNNQLIKRVEEPGSPASSAPAPKPTEPKTTSPYKDQGGPGCSVGLQQFKNKAGSPQPYSFRILTIRDNDGTSIGSALDQTDAGHDKPMEVASKLENKLKLTPEEKGDYIQFDLGDLHWKSTDKPGDQCKISMDWHQNISGMTERDMDCWFECKWGGGKSSDGSYPK